MSPHTLHDSLRLFTFIITLVHCSSIDFFIGQAFDECSINSQTVACDNNTDRGGLCAYASDVNKIWCCPAPDPTCWSRVHGCNGNSSAAPGPGQISCLSEGFQWCCNQEYEICTQKKDQINICTTKFASGNANVSIAQANAVESSSTSTTSSATSSSPTTSSTATSTPQSKSASPGASKPLSALSPGAIAGIVIGVILAIVLGLLISWSIIRARRRPTHEAQSTIPTNKIMIPEMGDDVAKSELDGRRLVVEMPGQETRHELL